MAKRKKAARRNSGKGSWSSRDLNILTKEFPNKPTAEIAKAVGRKTDAVKKKASRMGLKKNKRYLKSIGRA